MILPQSPVQRVVRMLRSIVNRFVGWKIRSDFARPLRVITAVQLGDKRLIAIVEAEDQRFLIGAAQNSVALLTPLPESKFRKKVAAHRRSNEQA